MREIFNFLNFGKKKKKKTKKKRNIEVSKILIQRETENHSEKTLFRSQKSLPCASINVQNENPV